MRKEDAYEIRSRKGTPRDADAKRADPKAGPPVQPAAGAARSHLDKLGFAGLAAKFKRPRKIVLVLNLSYQPIEASTITSGFRCGARELDQFFAKKAKKQHERGTILTTCAFLPGIGAPVGFYSIASVAEEIQNLPDRPYHRLGDCDHFPALQLVYLAVHHAHQGRGIGSAMAGAVIELFANVGQTIGIPYLILVPINDEVIPFYEDQLGFICYRDRCRMHLPLRDAVLAMRTPPANDTGKLFEDA